MPFIRYQISTTEYEPIRKRIGDKNLSVELLSVLKSSRQEVFCKKVVLKNFFKFTVKHLCHGLFFNKVAGLRPATLLKKRLWHRCFPVNFAKFLRTPFLIEHLPWLLLNLFQKTYYPKHSLQVFMLTELFL